MTPALYHHVLDRLTAADDLDDLVVALVDAACRSEDALAAALCGDAPARPKSVPPTAARPSGTYLRELEVSGFRGIGPAQKLELQPGPGLTLIVGRNGSGKSSFSEALEVLLTGSSSRWNGRPKEWQGGWRNLHEQSGTYVSATFSVEGSEAITLRRVWRTDADITDSELRIRRGKESLDGGLAALGWSEPLVTFRPFLGHSELGAVLEQPSKLYDPLKRILGLEELEAAVTRLGDARKQHNDRAQHVKRSLATLLPRLEALDDARAVACRTALAGKRWELPAIDHILLGSDATDNDVVQRLQRLAELTPPPLTSLGDAAAELRAALAAQKSVSQQHDAIELAQLLELALRCAQAAGGPCPVCEAPLAEDWHDAARTRLDAAKANSETARQAAARVDAAVRAVRALVTAPPDVLRRVAALDLPGDALRAWEAWAALPADPAALCDHAETGALDVETALETLRREARARVEGLEAAWLPIARDLAAWLAEARIVTEQRAALAALKKAEAWLKDAEAQLRDERFRPIATHAQRIWSLLRHDSNVDLASVKLGGTGTRRRVDLDVTVDGAAGVALGVMSQGELNTLALSLFLPRMTLGESPFHFLVIDDPVQAMDPHKVDGLATVLADVAETFQVIVFTHDNRLFEAIRRLGIEATVFEAQRRAQSVVALSRLADPIERHLRDAMQCVHHEQDIGPRMAGHTVPTFCRLALEAACAETFRRRRLAKGDAHLAVELALEDAKTLHDLASLAIQDADDERATSTLFATMNKQHGSWTVDLLKDLKEHAHTHYAGDLRTLVNRTRDLAQRVRTLP